MKPIMINATDRNTISIDKNQFYFNKFLTSKSITYQNDVLTKETVKTKGLKTISAVCGIIATCFMIYNYMNSDTTVKTAALVAARTSKTFNKTNSLLSHGYGDEDQGTCWADQQSCRYADHYNCLADRVSPLRDPASQMFHHMRKDEPSQGWTPFTDEYMNKKTGTSNKS